MDWFAIQGALRAKGYYMPPLVVDGMPGKGTRAAVRDYRRDNKLGDGSQVTDALLISLGLPVPQKLELIVPPWLAIINGKKGLREKEDNEELKKFLRSDGQTLGDPKVFPWCGDLVETAYLNAGFGPVPSNPYLARNWKNWQTQVDFPTGLAVNLDVNAYGGLGVFERPGPKGNEGHVGEIVGISPDGKRLRVRGGNQNNRIGDSWLIRTRLLSCRVPTSYGIPLSRLPVLADNGEPASTNEA